MCDFNKLFCISTESDVIINENDYVKYWGIYGKYFIAGVIFSTRLPEMIYKKIKNSPFCAILLLVVFWAAVYCMYMGMDDVFMYFRF